MFNGFYTITSPSGEHRTFQVRTQDDGPLAGKRIVSMLIGDDNQSDYTGFGFVTEKGIVVWKSRRGAGEPSFWDKSAKLIWSLAQDDDASPYARRGFQMLLDKRCMRCNRKLTNPASILAGIGPECAGRIAA